MYPTLSASVTKVAIPDVSQTLRANRPANKSPNEPTFEVCDHRKPKIEI